MTRRLLALLPLAVLMAQTTPPANVQMRNGQPRAVTPTAIVDADGNQIGTATNPLVVTGGTGNGNGGGGDASATNQQTQITAANLTNTRLGDVTTPATGSVNQRLGLINTTLGSPFQAGGSIANTAFGIAGSLPAGTNTLGTVNLGTLNGAATLAAQNTGNASLATIAGTAGATGSTAPTTAQLMGGAGPSGNLRAIATDAAGALAAPTAGTANRVITKTSVAANTSTTICPASATPVSAVEIQVGARTGLGINGQSLTQVERGTATTTPDIMAPAADTLYSMPIGATNAITAYSATAFVSLCIQTLRPL